MEVATLIIATISAILQGVQTWLQSKDAKQARDAARSARDTTLADPKTAIRAQNLVKLVPKDTLDRMRRKVDECYKKFDEMMDNAGEKYFPDDITRAAHGALPYCVCDSLNIMKGVVGDLPDEDLKDAWRKYDCQARVAKHAPS